MSNPRKSRFGGMDPTSANSLGEPSTRCGLQAAEENDHAFFETHPHVQKYRRKAIPGEEPQSLRSSSIREVLVRRMADGIYLRLFIDARGHMVRPLLFFGKELLLTAAGRERAKLSLMLFDSVASLGTTNGSD